MREPQAALDADDEKIVEVARLTEPVLGERHEVGVAVDRHGDAEPPRQVRAEGHVAVAEDRTLPAYACRALHDAGQADADAENVGHFEVGVLDAAPHAVFDEVGDDGRRLPVDADRQRERVEDIGAEIGDGDRDLVGREAHADHIGRVRIELQHDARAATARVTHGPDLQRSDQPVVEKRGGDRGDRGGAELGDLADLDAGHRPMAANRVHHMEAVDRAHEFWVGGLHRFEGVSADHYSGAGINSPALAGCQRPCRQRVPAEGPFQRQPKPRSRLTASRGRERFNLHLGQKQPGPDFGRKTMSLRHLALAAICAAAFSAPAFADTTVTMLHVSEDKTDVRRFGTRSPRTTKRRIRA